MGPRDAQAGVVCLQAGAQVSLHTVIILTGGVRRARGHADLGSGASEAPRSECYRSTAYAQKTTISPRDAHFPPSHLRVSSITVYSMHQQADWERYQLYGAGRLPTMLLAMPLAVLWKSTDARWARPVTGASSGQRDLQNAVFRARLNQRDSRAWEHSEISRPIERAR